MQFLLRHEHNLMQEHEEIIIEPQEKNVQKMMIQRIMEVKDGTIIVQKPPSIVIVLS